MKLWEITHNLATPLSSLSVPTQASKALSYGTVIPKSLIWFHSARRLQIDKHIVLESKHSRLRGVRLERRELLRRKSLTC